MPPLSMAWVTKQLHCYLQVIRLAATKTIISNTNTDDSTLMKQAK